MSCNLISSWLLVSAKTRHIWFIYFSLKTVKKILWLPFLHYCGTRKESACFRPILFPVVAFATILNHLVDSKIRGECNLVKDRSVFCAVLIPVAFFLFHHAHQVWKIKSRKTKISSVVFKSVSPLHLPLKIKFRKDFVTLL